MGSINSIISRMSFPSILLAITDGIEVEYFVVYVKFNVIL